MEEIRTGFERPFWIANITEIFERLAYYGAFASLALYLQEQLNFSTEQTGTLTGIFGGMVWFLAIFGGAAADRLGFRRALSVAYLILGVSYFLIGSIGASWLAPVRNAVPLGLFVGFILILPALGISLVKPCVVGTTARASKENVRSIGYSIYYTMVNIGGAAGPFFASWAHRHLGVENVYRVVALGVFAMFFVVLLVFPRAAEGWGCASAIDRDGRAKFLCCVGKLWLVLPVLLVALLLRIALWTKPEWSVPWWIWIVFLGAGARRHQPLHVVSRDLYRLLDRFLAAVHQSARIHSRLHQCACRRRNDSGGRRIDGHLSDPGGKFPDAQDSGISRRSF